MNKNHLSTAAYALYAACKDQGIKCAFFVEVRQGIECIKVIEGLSRIQSIKRALSVIQSQQSSKNRHKSIQKAIQDLEIAINNTDKNG